MQEDKSVITAILQNIGSSGGGNEDAVQTDIATTLLARDYKGLSNYGSNGVIEVIKMAYYDVYNDKWHFTDACGTLATHPQDGHSGTFLVAEVAKMNEIKLGNIYGEHNGSDFAGNVWDKDGISPAITTMQGGGRQPHIVEVNRLGNIYGFDGGSYDGNVYDSNGLCPTQRSCQEHGSVPEVVDVQRIGSLEETSNQRRQVYDSDGLSPTIQAACGMGGGNQPMVTEIKELGSLYDQHSRWGVYDENGISPTLPAAMGEGGGYVPMLSEQMIVAMRGRNPENPSDRRAGIELEQRLEPNTEGISNTITTVEKDNMVLDAKCLRMVCTEEGKELRKAYEAHEIKHGFNEYREAEPRPDDCANTLTSVNKDNNIVETKKIKIRQATKDGFVECEIGGVCDLNYVSSDTRRDRVQDGGRICPTLTTENIPDVIELGDPDFYNFLYEINGSIYLIRIRKLIPLECWRLMNFDDEDFFKAETVVSNTQLYKQAGNSIVRNVLVAVFGQMLEGKESVYKEVS